MLLPLGSGIVGEKLVTPQTLVSGLLDAFVIAELQLHIGTATKRACLGDTHIHGDSLAILGQPLLVDVVSMKDARIINF